MSSARLSGVGVSSGRATGPVVRVAEALPEPPAGLRTADTKMEASLIRPAAEVVVQRLMERAKTVEGDARAVLETTAAMAGDPSLIKAAEKLVVDQSLTAARAVHQAAEKFISALQASGGYMAERARDVQDVRDRLVAELLGLPAPGVPDLASPSVLVARDLAPADTAGLDPSKVLALVTEEGGPTSHTAILARSLGIPAVVACRGILAFEGTSLDVDGDTGQVRESDGKVRAAGTGKKAEWNGVGVLKDGHRVKVLGNVGSPADAQAAAQAGAEGVGLFRTEFCFLDAAEEPTVAEQTAAYEAVLAPFAGKPVVVRTLDAGADKPLAFLNPDPEPNPALGVRGLRVAFDRPEILDRQLEAIAAAAKSSGADVSVMAPMVATAAEAAWFVDRARKAGIQRAEGDGRGPVRGPVGEGDPPGRRLHLHRHQRPGPVRLRRRPPARWSRRAERPVAARVAAPDRPGRRRGDRHRQARRRLRRGGGRPAARVRADRPRHHVVVHEPHGSHKRRREARDDQCGHLPARRPWRAGGGRPGFGEAGGPRPH